MRVGVSSAPDSVRCGSNGAGKYQSIPEISTILRTSEKPLECTPDEAREIVVLVVIHAGHLGRLAADQRATRDAAALGDALDDGGAGLDVELAGGEIVEEEQRLGALDDQVVDAHGDEGGADVVMAAGGDGDLQLGADPVGRGDQQGIAVAELSQVEERAEAAEAGGAAAPRGRPGERLDRLDQRVAGVDVDTGLSVGLAVYGVLPEDRLYSGHGRRRWTRSAAVAACGAPFRPGKARRRGSDTRRGRAIQGRLPPRPGGLGRAAKYLIRDGLQ